ncbi:RNA 3'-terminal phosphate cyclase [bacterium]|nr:RNA 3'-terminal phosphate cyclase [bacterium]
MSDWIVIDGSMGEGGGQIVRSALALSLVTGKPCRIEKIRAGRKKPGLLRQHLTALQASAKIGGAKVTGDSIGSNQITFEPTRIAGGDYHFAVGTAGSTTLVLQTILPALVIADSESTLTLEGGTHNPLAPTFDFLQKAFLPVLHRMGVVTETRLDCYGFYPAGGGKANVKVKPASKLTPIDLVDRGAILNRRARAIVASLPKHIAERELATLQKTLSWPSESFELIEVKDCPGPGNILMTELESENITEVFTSFGEKGVLAEAVAGRALEETTKYLKAGVPVGSHLADQLLLPFAMAGSGAFVTLPLSRHSTTNIEVIRKFLDVDIQVERAENRNCFVRISR